MSYFIGIFSLMMLTATGNAQIIDQDVEYRDGDTALEGYMAYDQSKSGTRPGVLIVHQWMGLTDYEKMRARQLADLGYVVFALDMYGKNIRPTSMEEAADQAGKYRNDRELMRQRAAAGLEALRNLEICDSDKIAVIGYCFGGGVALELARSGADVRGTVSFHGNLDTPKPADAQNIKGKILVQHGGADPHVPQKQVMTFWDEMEKANVNWQMNVYGDVVHAFTQKSAGNDPSRGAAYNEQADQRSWQSMQNFFDEIF